MQTYADIYKEKLIIGRYSPNTIDTYLKTARSFFNVHDNLKIKDIGEKEIEKLN